LLEPIPFESCPLPRIGQRRIFLEIIGYSGIKATGWTNLLYIAILLQESINMKRLTVFSTLDCTLPVFLEDISIRSDTASFL
jgi:hypothetical protein